MDTLQCCVGVGAQLQNDQVNIFHFGEGGSQVKGLKLLLNKQFVNQFKTAPK